MADQDTVAPQQDTGLKPLSRQDALSWFDKKVKEKSGPQMALLNTLGKKYGKLPSEDQLLGAIAELPAVKSHFRIEGFGGGSGQPQPPGGGFGVKIPREAPGQPGIAQRAFVNNNPFNLHFAGQHGATKADNGDAKFATAEEGFQAGVAHIRQRAAEGMTFGEYISQFAPPSENDTKAYIANGAKELGVTEDTPLSKVDPRKLAKFQIHQESASSIEDAPQEASLTGSSQPLPPGSNSGPRKPTTFDKAKYVATVPLTKQLFGVSAADAAEKFISMASKAPGLITKGTIDFSKRPVVNNADGTHSTVKTTTIEEDGKTILIPTIVNGKEVSVQDASKHYHETGEHMGIFKTDADAQNFDRKLHNEMGWHGAPGSDQEKWQKESTLERFDNAMQRFNRAGIRDVADAVDTLQAPGSLAATMLAGPVLGALGKAAPWITKSLGLMSATYGAKKLVDFTGNIQDFLAHPSPETAEKAISNIIKAGAGVAGGTAAVGGQAAIKSDRARAAAEEIAVQARGKLRGLLQEIDGLKDKKALVQADRDRLTTLMNEAKDAVVQMRSPGADAAHARTMRIVQERAGGAPQARPQAAPETAQPQPPGAPPRLLPAAPTTRDMDVLQNASGLPRERIERLNKLSPEDLDRRYEVLRRQSESETSPVPDVPEVAGGKKAPQGEVERAAEINRKRNDLKQEMKAIDLIREEKGGGRKTAHQSPPEAGRDAWDAHAQKSYGKPYDQLTPQEKSRIDGLAGMGRRPGSTRSLPAATTGRAATGDEVRAGRVSTPPSGGPPPPGSPEIKRLTTTTPAGLIEEGPSGYAPMPESSRVSRVEANRLADKHKISPNTVIELSGHSNEDLVKAAKDLQTLKRQLIAHPNEMLPGTEEEGGYPVHKAERVDQLDRFINTLHDLLLYSRRPPTPPQ